MEHFGHHFIAVFGGSVAGSEAAFQLSKRGFRVVVFDQNALPYGKIEDGLPKWHAKLRDKEERLIDTKLDQPNIRFVPGVRLGRDIDFEDLVKRWGFSAVLIAVGAWKDRKLTIPEPEKWLNKGLIYQNPFMYWFNHKHEPGYTGPRYEVKDNALIVGGGLASLDVVKVIMLETVQEALLKKGIEEDMFTLERGIERVLDKRQLTLKDLGLKGCTLIYRRGAKDMPLTNLVKDTPEKIKKAEATTEKILNNFRSKYLFNFIPNHMVYDVLRGDSGEFSGLKCYKTKIVDGRVVPVEEATIDIPGSMVVSSIGSVPEKIPGIPNTGSVYKMADEVSCRIDGFENVFAIGNAVTGRGNIKESLQHGKSTTVEVMEQHFHWEEKDFEDWLRGTESNVEEQVESIATQINRKKYMSDEVIQSILDKTTEFQLKAGYKGKYRDWITAKLPIRLEQMLQKDHG